MPTPAPALAPWAEFDVDRVRALEAEVPYVRPSRERQARLSTVLLWGGGVLTLVGVLLIAAVGVERWFGSEPAPRAVVPEASPSVASLVVPGPRGSAAHAQDLVRGRAEAFAACVFRKGGGARGAADRGDRVGAPGGAGRPEGSSGGLPYDRCDSARAIGIDPSAISRRGQHGPIAGRGARSGLGLFTLHGGREAWLLQYDASGVGWGYSFAADGTVESQCRTRKGRLCWHLEDEPAGALFLGDDATVAALQAAMRGGRAAG